MKNRTFSTRQLSWALLLAIPFWLGACSKKDTDITPSASAIQGSWKVSAYTIDPAFDLIGSGTKTNDLLDFYKAFLGQPFVDCFKAVTVTFNANGKITSTTTSACSSVDASFVANESTWVLAGNKLTVTEGTDVNVFDVTISGNTLKLAQSITEDFDGDNKNDTATVTLSLTKV
ncbi:lipocalin family protein [Fibrella aquatica]|uniref:lipocalin family protein n=1 Tax=Fibrella aquatica TaxID=3242487 RepID=UPI00352279A3